MLAMAPARPACGTANSFHQTSPPVSACCRIEEQLFAPLSDSHFLTQTLIEFHLVLGPERVKFLMENAWFCYWQKKGCIAAALLNQAYFQY